MGVLSYFVLYTKFFFNIIHRIRWRRAQSKWSSSATRPFCLLNNDPEKKYVSDYRSCLKIGGDFIQSDCCKTSTVPFLCLMGKILCIFVYVTRLPDAVGYAVKVAMKMAYTCNNKKNAPFPIFKKYT